MDFSLEFLFWVLIALITLIVEVSTVSLVSIWFCLGAACAAFCAAFGAGFWIQFAVFLAVSVVAFLIMGKQVREFFRFRHEPTGTHTLLGKTGVVTERIVPGESGRIKVCGQDWKADAIMQIEHGAMVRITGLSGVTLQVAPI